ncbi:YeiH family protein [Salinicoccus sp. HZC-1]|uniref:YeiH family protein n=1 Tax=Salinicoccus sp. HZC-1 TaxID=3385497 RepID=UPI00398AD475
MISSIRTKGFITGILFTLVIAISGFSLAKLPVFEYIGPLATAIIIAFIYRQIFGYPYKIASGIQFSSKILLRAAIILYGLKLNIDIVFAEGLTLLMQSVIVIVFSIGATFIFAKMVKADMNISMLVGVGTGVCGAAAIAAVAPILKSKEEDTAISIGIIALLGTVFSIGYLFIRPYLPMDSLEYGTWAGLSLHELAHVALAAEPMGEDILAIALLAKLSRVFLLVPLCFILIFFVRRKQNKESIKKIPFPYFLIGFIIMSLFNSYVLGTHIAVNAEVMQAVSVFTSILLTMAMTALGLNINLKDTMKRASKPFMVILFVSLLLSLFFYMSI